MYASGVAQGVVEVEDLAVIQLLAGDDGHRARNFDNWRIGLGAGSRTGSRETGGRAPGAFKVAGGVDAGFRQGQCAFGGCHQGIGARAALLQLQAGATQGGLQSADATVLASDRCRSTAAGQVWVEGQGDASLAGDLIQRVRQWRGRQVVAAHGGLLSGDQRTACQRRGQGNGHGQQTGTQEGFKRTGHAAAPRRISAN
ncbi:hypothetical protein D3C72_1771720 [compost metagenome]